MKARIFNSKDELIEEVSQIMSIIKGDKARYLMELNLEQLSWQTEGEYFIVVKDNGYSSFYSSMSTVYTLEKIEEIDFIISICIGRVNAVTTFKSI